MFVSSCSKDTPLSDTEDVRLEDPMFAMTEIGGEEAMTGSVGTKIDGYDCFIRIIDVDLMLPSGQPYNGDFFMTISTDTDCSGGCDVIESFYDPLQCENNPTNCQLDVSTQNPLNRIDFNCLVLCNLS